MNLTLEDLDKRLGQEMARCARDYDEARDGLAEQHAASTSEIARLQTEIAKLKPTVERFLHGPEGDDADLAAVDPEAADTGLTKEIAADCLTYLDLLAQLQRARESARLAYPATLPPGEEALGVPLGTPRTRPENDASSVSEKIKSGIKNRPGRQVLVKGMSFIGGKWHGQSSSHPTGAAGIAHRARAALTRITGGTGAAHFDRHARQAGLTHRRSALRATGTVGGPSRSFHRFTHPTDSAAGAKDLAARMAKRGYTASSIAPHPQGGHVVRFSRGNTSHHVHIQALRGAGAPGKTAPMTIGQMRDRGGFGTVGRASSLPASHPARARTAAPKGTATPNGAHAASKPPQAAPGGRAAVVVTRRRRSGVGASAGTGTGRTPAAPAASRSHSPADSVTAGTHFGTSEKAEYEDLIRRITGKGKVSKRDQLRFVHLNALRTAHVGASVKKAVGGGNGPRRLVLLVKAAPTVARRGRDISDEPRVPKGQPGGGRWTDAGGHGSTAARVKPGDPHPTMPHLPPSTAAERARVRELGAERTIPLLSWGVEIDERPDAKNRATYYDQAGRKQYVRSELAASEANAHKFASLQGFRKALPAVRATVERDIAEEGTGVRRACAAVVRLIDKTAMRVGSEEYAQANDTYGAASLRRDHVTLADDGSSRVLLGFRGKHGQGWDRVVDDDGLYRAVSDFWDAAHDGVEATAKVWPVNETHIRAYLKPFGVNPKQFRTWAATKMAARLLLSAKPTEDEKVRAANVTEAVRRVAEHLGNTPAVCRSSYINPAVLDAYRTGLLRSGEHD